MNELPKLGKIWTDDVQTNINVQTWLFSLGYEWCGGGHAKKNIQYTEASSLYVYGDKTFAYSTCDKEHFNSSTEKEEFFYQPVDPQYEIY